MNIEHETELLLRELEMVRGTLSELRLDIAEVKERLGLLGAQCASLERRLERIEQGAQSIARALPHLT